MVDILIFLATIPIFRSWFKGNDTTTLLIFLERRLRCDLPGLSNDDSSFFGYMLASCEAANAFMRCMYHAPLWLSYQERDILLASGYKCVSSYGKCAEEAYLRDLPRFKFAPKIHMYNETLFTLEGEKRKNLQSLNPLSWCTQMDEDFIGHLASVSRAVSARTVHSRTLSRYEVALARKWWDL